MPRFAFVDALRGMAILMVMGVHTLSGMTSGTAQLVVSQGARGVQLFFVASALTLCMSWQARDDGTHAFYVRRLFRIAPMFWLALVFYIWRDGLAPNMYAPDGPRFSDVVLTAFFLHGLSPTAINSIVPGSWSVADEMLFYALFPFVVPWLLKRPAWLTLALIPVSMYLARWVGLSASHHMRLLSANPDHDYVIAGYFNLWLPSMTPVFLTGVFVFRIMELMKPPENVARCGLVLCIVAMVAFALGDQGNSLITRYGAVFGVFALCLAAAPTRLLVNPVMVWIGKVSYSAYLIHFAVLPLVPANAGPAASYGFVVAVTVALASAAYFLIEKPFMRLGHRIAMGTPKTAVLRQQIA